MILKAFFDSLPDVAKANALLALGAVVTAILTFIGLFVNRLINRDGKKADDSTKLRTDLMDRLKHMEGRLDQITTNNMTLTRENAEIKVKVEMYDEERKEVKEKLNKAEAKLEKAQEELLSIRAQLLQKDEIHANEKKMLEHRIEDLERQVVILEEQLAKAKGAEYHGHS